MLLVKLISGELVFSPKYTVEDLNERKGEKAYVMVDPVTVSDRNGYEFHPFLFGTTYDTAYFKFSQVIFAAEDDGIDPVLIETYQNR